MAVLCVYIEMFVVREVFAICFLFHTITHTHAYILRIYTIASSSESMISKNH